MLSRLAVALLAALPAVACAAVFPAGSPCAMLDAGDIAASYRQLAEWPAANLSALDGQTFTVRVEDAVEDRWDVERLAADPDHRVRLTYRMGRNDVTEGWNWHPEADQAREDYYRYKYLPLGQRETETSPPRLESDPAYGSFQIKFTRRDAYYFAFDNPYEFYARNDADGGFAVETSAADTEKFQLVARGRYTAPRRTDSTTYWRAIPSQPVDLTLKNRYYMGRLETLWFCSADGRILGKLGK
jgi:hypothetical protein